jgi:crossover junction endodeoxyribonuclease RuvC
MTDLVLGVDPGLATMGWAVVQDEPLHLLDSGTFTTPASDDLSERLLNLYGALGQVLERYPISTAALEGLFYRPGLAKTALLLGHARGTLLLGLAQAGIVTREYPATEVRRALGISGRADKERVHRIVLALLGPHIPNSDHIWDAAALALCHIFRCRHPNAQVLTPP